jgi:hypothetical protein
MKRTGRKKKVFGVIACIVVVIYTYAYFMPDRVVFPSRVSKVKCVFVFKGFSDSGEIRKFIVEDKFQRIVSISGSKLLRLYMVEVEKISNTYQYLSSYVFDTDVSKLKYQELLGLLKKIKTDDTFKTKLKVVLLSRYWVKKNISYKEESKDDLKVILNKKEGNCKAKALVLKEILDRTGIESHIAGGIVIDCYSSKFHGWLEVDHIGTVDPTMDNDVPASYIEFNRNYKSICNFNFYEWKINFDVVGSDSKIYSKSDLEKLYDYHYVKIFEQKMNDILRKIDKVDQVWYKHEVKSSVWCVNEYMPITVELLRLIDESDKSVYSASCCFILGEVYFKAKKWDLSKKYLKMYTDESNKFYLVNENYRQDALLLLYYMQKKGL